MKNNEKKYLFFNKKMVMVAAAVMMMGQICFMPKIAQNTVMATQPGSYNDFSFIITQENLFNNQGQTDLIADLGVNASEKFLEMFASDGPVQVANGIENKKLLLDNAGKYSVDQASGEKLKSFLTSMNSFELVNLYGQDFASSINRFFKDSNGVRSMAAIIDNMVKSQRNFYNNRLSEDDSGLGIGTKLSEVLTQLSGYLVDMKSYNDEFKTKNDKKTKKILLLLIRD